MMVDSSIETSETSRDEGQNIWSSVLTQVETSSSNKLPSRKAVLVLGENESGKTSLIAKMQGNDDPRKGSGLEYHHILVRDEYRDEHTRLGFWLLDGDASHQNLLKFALNHNSLEDTSILLVASMTTPWDILESLEKWAKILEDHLNHGMQGVKPERLAALKNQSLRRFQEYVSPGDEIEAQLVSSSPLKPHNHKMSISSSDSADPKDSLPQDVLTHNLGLDITVAITKTDYMSVLEKEHDFKDEAFDFIQQAVRKFCLKYGASLCYVSAKINKNCDLLYKYLVHRIYGLPFKTPALVVEKDALFIPCGWDNEKKIAILYENIQSVSPDDPYADVIQKPQRMPVGMRGEDELMAEDDQIFLTKMQSQLNQSIPSNASPQNPGFRPSPAVQKSNADRRSLAGVVQSPTPTQLDVSKGSPGGEGVLQNFFNSLLNRKSGAGLSSPNTPRNMSDTNNKSRVDVAAELDRMTSGSNSQKMINQQNNSSSANNSIVELTSQTPTSD